MSIKGENVWGFPSLVRSFKKFSGERKLVPSSSPIKLFEFSVRFLQSFLTHLSFSFFFFSMAEPSNPLSTSAENPEPLLPMVAEEEVEVDVRDFDEGYPNAPGVWATYPQEGDTTGDAPAGYVTMFADFFGDCNLRLPLANFVAEVLDYYKLHISQLSPLGMIRVRNFEYTFHALGIEPIVGDFQRFYQLSVSMGFFSFRQREGTPKLMVLPKDTVDWFPTLRIIGWVKLDNRQLWVLRMMLGRMSRDTRPVVREKSGEDAPLWRMFCPDFKGEVAIVACADGEEGFNRTIRDNFRLPDQAAL
ncbi:hypothetical protein Hanom_Chr07g00613791 [Helianthus anomalus]